MSSNQNARDITSVGDRAILWLHSSRLEEDLAAYREGQYSALGINASRGFVGDTIEFLREHTYVDGLHIVPGASQFELAPISQLTRLRSIVINGPSVGLSIGSFPLLEEFRGYWHQELLSDHSTLRLLDLSEFRADGGDLRGIPDGLPALEEIVLVQPRKLKSLMSISRFQSLRIVELAHAKTLQSLSDIEALRFLSCLKCDSCRNVQDAESVLAGLNLKVLGLNRFAPLLSLKFVEKMPSLEEFRFVDTNVVDGDLRPLLRLRSVGFLPKKHFSHRPEDIERAIGQEER